MQFGVIYSVDLYDPYDPGTAASFGPCSENGAEWTCTEHDVEEGLSEDCVNDHRKWVACLTREQFDDFVEDLSLYPEETRTAGALGMPEPGAIMNCGHAPFLLFRRDLVDWDEVSCREVLSGELQAYVTPYPETCTHPLDERDWERVRRAVLRHYD